MLNASCKFILISFVAQTDNSAFTINFLVMETKINFVAKISRSKVTNPDITTISE